MSAQRRTASKRSATASPRRPAPTGNGAAAAAAAPATAPARHARPPIPERPRPVTESQSAVRRRLDSLRRAYDDTVAEMKKIVWPDRETTKNLTLVVIGISIVLGILLGGIDFLLQSIFEALP